MCCVCVGALTPTGGEYIHSFSYYLLLALFSTSPTQRSPRQMPHSSASASLRAKHSPHCQPLFGNQFATLQPWSRNVRMASMTCATTACQEQHVDSAIGAFRYVSATLNAYQTLKWIDALKYAFQKLRVCSAYAIVYTVFSLLQDELGTSRF